MIDAVCYECGTDEPGRKGGIGDRRLNTEQDPNEDGVRVCDDRYWD
jgi:hypothetical protein